MAIVTKIKWVILSVITLSVASVVLHLSFAKFWTVSILQYGAVTGLPEDFASRMGRQVIKNKKLWGAIESLETLQPYVNPRSSYSVPKEQYNGFIYAKVFGGFAQIRSSICDLVAISRLLNATLVIPEIQQSTQSKGISSKFKSFSYIYNEEQFIAYLKNDIIIAKTLPGNLKERRRRNEFPIFKLKSSTSPNFYIEEVLPKLKKSKVIGFIISAGGCLQSILPPSLSEIQRLRCRVAFHALQFRPEIKIVGQQMVNKLRALGQPFLAFHPGLLRDILAYHGCAELFQDVHTELIQHRRAQMIKERIIKEELNIDSRLQRDKGLCPLSPEEVGILLRVMGYPSKTIVYLAGSETFGGQRVLIPLRALFANLVDRTSLCSEKDLSDLVGPEAPVPLNVFQPPPVSAEKLKEEWKKAGPRPRPLPPPPDRPIYQHEKEGWYGWITETPTEPDPSPVDLRNQAHRLIWDALDYIVSLEADAFFPGFNDDGSGWPDFSSIVMGHRLYESASSRTYRPDRKTLAELFNITRDNIYHPKHNWTVLVQEHLNNSLGEEGLIRQSLRSKPTMFLSHPLPECSCRVTSSAKPVNSVKSKDGRVLFGDEEECPKWMKHASQAGSGTEGGVMVEDNGLPDYETNDLVEESESEKNGKTNVTLIWEQDEEMDPND
ncbi:protein EMBRYO SAC DEVELOPMENT ARREST 30 [Prosopis cineraria]|uniref:protein EMBRYO SAC DEVELOPMENT ARREST 30 n=1 Tax=Prosopis cineraria TaxID=364024 RepID=UPI00240EFF89|nr:protein EMBRYO SAC DEVELOPMENT ARREST 30 [Prosopis cineraria]XP_054777734.1 protein EMBRYO SAC DEVELOPMENT ARREST 30 [Prosopis cineraria]XP_054777735.1 protein EMBRYO SAC DEVELOPMENT ARREST 30 [Prosopis cineraria]XP_054777736.1 protein EMBRYO SAC DEVELOPMENT ARREST 30 [Prosopis cineraria]XP_054777738.1 protein EMBRYO SAC DEVELOPMENT ARREST 30 [Prosopis cineraria]